MARVLVVDDSEDLLDLYMMILEGAGYEVAGAADGAIGLERVNAFHPEVVVLDMMMPRLDGLGFLAGLPACTPPLPRVIASSGFDGYRDEALRRGAHAFLSKPISTEVFLAAVAAAVPGERIADAQLAENTRQVQHSRKQSEDSAALLIAKLTKDTLRPLRECIDALVEWVRRYYGFGECFLHLVRGDDVFLEANFGSDRRFLEPGMQYPRKNVYCDEVIDAGSTLLLSDPLRHPVERFCNHNEVRRRGWHFYIGAPLATSSGAVFGTLCLMDRTPHQMYAEDIRLFEALAAGVATMLVDVAEGRAVTRHLIDGERVFDQHALDLLVCTGVRRLARTGGKLHIAKFGVRDPAQFTAVVRKAYGVTSGLRFAVASTRTGAVLLHDGTDADIVDNNLNVVRQLIATASSTFESVAWTTRAEQELSAEEARIEAARLLSQLGIS